MNNDDGVLWEVDLWYGTKAVDSISPVSFGLVDPSSTQSDFRGRDSLLLVLTQFHNRNCTFTQTQQHSHIISHHSSPSHDIIVAPSFFEGESFIQHAVNLKTLFKLAKAVAACSVSQNQTCYLARVKLACMSVSIDLPPSQALNCFFTFFKKKNCSFNYLTLISPHSFLNLHVRGSGSITNVSMLVTQ